ncbi:MULTISPECIES: cyanophycin synthetase [unclassified Nostoc]|uniref:cyanophycin synthetase n=1 Tax=unclassified Nostoc TaxID=2593658 RepID=UPI002AD43F4F|nr:cyanophycin synthetase [Nostoc sp. DedQUE03]MDZ7977572.1 cyanophycin synthetase [Nostoc sp. DedQUE03]MDZ8049347.1 cyanophycin synthetase [Nostoc sp. DedQUE02]
MDTPFVTSIIQKVADKIGAVVLVDPECTFVGLITFKNGNKTFFRNSRFSINSSGSTAIAKDKGVSNFFLNKFGYKVTEGKTFFSEELCEEIANSRNIDAGFYYAKELEFPVIIKPLNLSQGTFVTKVHNKQEYYQAAKKILQKTSVFIVERFYSGNDYRIVVLDDEVVSAYQRIPLFIMGDGQSTILELMQQKQENFIKNGRKEIIDFEDYRIKKNLRRRKLNFNTVIPKNNIIYLLDNANLSTGGEAVDFTENIHPDFQKLAISITKDMELRLAGVDILTNDITSPMEDYTIIEVNSAPSLSHYASFGEVQTKRVENLYLKVLKALENENNREKC